jgi:hypothetical protein
MKAQPAATAKLRQRWYSAPKWFRRTVIAVAIYTVVGFIVLPALLKWQLRKQLPRLTHRAADVDAVRVNPYALSLGVRGLRITEPDGSTFASFSNFYVNFEAVSSVFNRAWTFKEIRLGSPYAYAAILTNGQFNFASLLTNAPATNAPPATNPPPALLVKALNITNGVISVADFYRATPFQSRFAPIQIGLTNFTTRPKTGSPYAFTASTGEGEYFNWSGTLRAFPPMSAGTFELGGIDLKKYGTYLREFAQFDVRAGKVTLQATYAVAAQTNGLELAVTNAALLLTNLMVFSPTNGAAAGTNALVSIPSISVQGAQANLQNRVAEVELVEMVGAAIFARRFKDGVVELVQLAMPPTNRAPSILNPPATKSTIAPLKADSPATPWSVLVKRIDVKDAAVRVNDEFPPQAAILAVDQINVAVEGLSLASNAPVKVKLTARVNETGGIGLDAQGSFLPLAVKADIDVSKIEFRPFQPYVDQQQVKLAVKSGNVSTKGRLSLAVAGTNPPAIGYAGEVIVGDVAVTDQVVFQDVVKWKQVALRGLEFSLRPMSVKLRELACDDLAANVVLATNGQLAVLAALPQKTKTAGEVPEAPSPSGPAAPPLQQKSSFPMQLDLLALTNTSIQFADLSIQPNCRFAVEQFGGTVRGLSSALDSTAHVDIAGRVNETSPFSIAGRINPLARDLLVDLVISNHNTELTAFTPYMEKFAGYPLQKGKLTLGLKYHIEQQALEARNLVFVDQLTLGAKNDNPDATKLPVKLGVALLKDRNGRIELDVPVKGRMDDPKFRVVPIVWQVVMNLLIKAAASPFALLGALVGGGEELSYIEFAPGQSMVTEVELQKVEKLGKALYERPALNLEMTGSADETLDRAALAWTKLEQEIKAARGAELAGKSEEPGVASEVQLQSRDYVRTLKATYKKTFDRDRPLPPGTTNVAAVGSTPASATRSEQRKGAEAQITRSAPKLVARTTNAPTLLDEARISTRPASLPALPEGDEALAEMEKELFARVSVQPEDFLGLMQQRAQSVQRALLKTERVTAERLFILAPPAAGTATNGQSRVNLSLN